MVLYAANVDVRRKGPYLQWEDTAGAETGQPQTSTEIELLTDQNYKSCLQLVKKKDTATAPKR